ncbi:MAG: putative toxin-antitoxin system toxin component, PIN family [Chloroflexota bacterium]
MRVIFDTNVVISGLIWSGTPGKVLQVASDGVVQAVASETLVDELRAVLQRPKFEKYLSRCRATHESLVLHYLSFAQIIEPIALPSDTVRDVKDVMVLEVAIGGAANAIVTGDDDLLTLKMYDKIEILTVTDFLDRVDSEEPRE